VYQGCKGVHRFVTLKIGHCIIIKTFSVIEHVAMIFFKSCIGCSPIFFYFLAMCHLQMSLVFPTSLSSHNFFRGGGWAHWKNYLLPFHSFCHGPTQQPSKLPLK
jgi:hypothetical protein